ncbi:DUF5753 domain-containing protein [Catenuloplanes japonicus]|uniref:DUF5753 domain-containing protein n=1 Tax=Catenuloplanes japonicus TaxID=33876 RepID=UPI00068DDEEE|nr:DUF5753 domain-containing protein [Catenuloplanes japonicus]
MITAWLDLYLGMEAAASTLRQYAPALIPGLLQTPEYATAILSLRAGVTPTETEQRVRLRMDRQRLFTRRAPKPPTMQVRLDEGVLRRPIADRAAWARQLAHLVNVQQKHDVSVRVIPHQAGPHEATSAGPFVVLEFPGRGARAPEPTTVYCRRAVPRSSGRD